MRPILDALRNLRSRPSRTFFTVAGIAIGILALTMVGSLAERLHTIVARSTSLNDGTIFAVIDRGTLADPSARPLIEHAAVKLRALDGVRAIVPEVVLPYRPDNSESGRFGPPSLIFGFPDAARELRANALAIRTGRDVRPGERRVAVIGADFAAAEPAHVGDVIALYGNSFTVIGIYEKSFTLFDEAIVVPFGDAQALMMQIVPPTLHALPQAGITAFLVAAQPKADTSLLVRRINVIDGLNARDPAEIANAVRSTLGIFDAIVFGAALIALLVGAFSIVNTMTIAVAERTHEIGIRKAIGATDGAVLGEFVAEAAAIGALGGIAGIVLGALLVLVIDARSAPGNLELFALSPRVAGGSFLFSVALSMVAGFVPALSAARLAPTEALRRS